MVVNYCPIGSEQVRIICENAQRPGSAAGGLGKTRLAGDHDFRAAYPWAGAAPPVRCSLCWAHGTFTTYCFRASSILQ
jgi:hypothetical protein